MFFAKFSDRDPRGFWSNGIIWDMRIYVRVVGVVVDILIPIDTIAPSARHRRHAVVARAIR